MSALNRIQRCPAWVWVLVSGLLFGLNAPGRHTQLVGMVSLFPFFLALESIHANPVRSWRKKLLLCLAASWGVGIVAAPIGVNWMIHCLEVFGHLPWPPAYLITSAGYGLEVGYLLFACFAFPLFFIRRRAWWDIPARLAFYLMLEPLLPQIFQWSFPGMTFDGFPVLSQLADVIGAPGLGLFNIGFCFLLLLLWRWKVERIPVPPGFRRSALALYLLAWCAGLAYGAWRIADIESKSKTGQHLDVALIQPNFSLGQLASNPELAYSDREENLAGLIGDSARALNEFPDRDSVPSLVVWPESTYPAPYFKYRTPREIVERFAREYNTFVLLCTRDWEYTAGRTRHYSIVLLVGPDGSVVGRYDKIFLIPFGEYIPLAETLPWFAEFLREHVDNISEFVPGKEFTVFRMPDGTRLSAAVCFDAFSESIIRNMTRNGAEMVVLLSNLAWFGKTLAWDHMEMTTRWKAIEHRVPIAIASNNGRSVILNALGNRISDQLGLFEQGSISETVTVGRHFSVYREYTGWVHAAFALLFLLTAALAQRMGGIFSAAAAK